MIEVRGITKSFEDKTILENVSLQIDEGDTIAIIGRSGSGKSVLMKHIIGLMKPDSGEVLVDGVNLHEISYSELREVRKKFGVLFQGGALFDSMNAFENVAFPLRTFTRMSEQQIEERVLTCLTVVELLDARSKSIAELSGGMRKRVALARAVAMEPKYIFYDEPNSGLDPQTSNTIDELISALGQDTSVTSIVVTHDMHSVLEIADRAAFIHEGKIHWVGTVDELHDSNDKILLDFVKANEYKIGRNGSH